MPTEPTGLEHVTPVKIKDTSATERAGFRKCRRQWFLTVVHRLDPQEGNPNFFLGTIYHSGLEAYYKTILTHQEHDAKCKPGKPCKHTFVMPDEVALDAYQAAYDKYMAKLKSDMGMVWSIAEPGYRELGELGIEMLQNYIDREANNPLFDEVVAVEFRVNVAIRNPKNGRKVGVLSVQADVVGMKDGFLCVADHKTASRELPSAHLDLDDQLTAEVFAWWQATGAFPERAIYNVSYKKHAGPPALLKSGKALSKAKDQGTTYAMYRQAIEDHGFNVADYVDILTALKEREERGEDPLFRREEVFRTPGQMDAFERDLFHEFQDMKRVAAHPEMAYPNPTSMECGRCPVRSICTTIQDGGDVAAIIQAGFVIADPRR